VTPRTDKLLAETKEWCDAQHGRRSELARAVGTSPQIVTDWLAEKRRKTPTLEQGLAILELLKKERRSRRH
jgi:DNA-binding transcriptional regulator YiaG